MPNIRYVRNTSGEYTGFVASGHLFTPECEWLGVLQGTEVFNVDGEYIGTIWPDDRLVRNRLDGTRRSILKPRRPLRPVRPLPPRRALYLPALTPPNQDVFEGLVRPINTLTPLGQLQKMYGLQGASLVAANGTFLGLLSRERSHEQSLGNPAGLYGNPLSELSILNQGGAYGSMDSDLSPFSDTAEAPPLIENGAERLGRLSANRNIQNRVDPNALLAWLAMV